jgi:NAD-dependent deacetylase
MSQLSAPTTELLAIVRDRVRRVLVLTGAGISAESGIPTFRGADGYWTVGSRQYTPQEFATQAMFRRHPELVWAFYVYRIGVCKAARPNVAHHALVRLEQHLGDRFHLVTQNVDGLHLMAGHSPDRVYQIHGSLRRMRCLRDCRGERWDLPIDDLEFPASREEPLSARNRELLRCHHCGGWARPHVLWFDEYYDEQDYHFESALSVAEAADLLLVIGTSGATNLPLMIARTAAERGTTTLEIGPEPTAFTQFTERTGGSFLQGKATELVPRVVEELLGSS